MEIKILDEQIDLCTVIVSTKSGTYQVALTKEMSDYLISELRMIYFPKGEIKVIDNKLTFELDLE